MHVRVYLKRAFTSSKDEVTAASRASVRGARARSYLLTGAIVAGVIVAAATLPVQHRLLHLPGKHDHREGSVAFTAPASPPQ